MGEVIQLQGDQRKDVQEFLVDKKEGLELDAKTIKARIQSIRPFRTDSLMGWIGPWVLDVAKLTCQRHLQAMMGTLLNSFSAFLLL